MKPLVPAKCFAGSIGGGLKKLQARFTAASAELEEAKQARAEGPLMNNMYMDK